MTEQNARKTSIETKEDAELFVAVTEMLVRGAQKSLDIGIGYEAWLSVENDGSWWQNVVDEQPSERNEEGHVDQMRLDDPAEYVYRYRDEINEEINPPAPADETLDDINEEDFDDVPF